MSQVTSSGLNILSLKYMRQENTIKTQPFELSGGCKSW